MHASEFKNIEHERSEGKEDWKWTKEQKWVSYG